MSTNCHDKASTRSNIAIDVIDDISTARQGQYCREWKGIVCYRCVQVLREQTVRSETR